MGAGDRKAVRDAGQNNLSVRQTRSALHRALELNGKIFTGAGAEARQSLGTQLPDWMVPNQVADPETAQATEEWRQIMTPEAVTKMATTLAGSDSNFELQQFVRMFADPKTTPQTRERMIRRMLEMTDAQEAYNNDLIEESKGADVIAEPAAPTNVSPDNPTSPEPPRPPGAMLDPVTGRYFILLPDGTPDWVD
jgi:cytochrome c biogenesis protein ResB